MSSVIGPIFMTINQSMQNNMLVNNMNRDRNAKSGKNSNKNNPMYNGNPKQMKGNPKGFNSTKVNRSFKSGN